MKISLLHIDVDVYDAAKCCLDYLFDKVVSGGVVILDDYGSVGGETRAVDEFIETRGGGIRILKTPYYSVPCHIIK
jgi:hypothetical protein